MNKTRARRDKAMDELDAEMGDQSAEDKAAEEDLAEWADQALAQVQRPKTQALEKEADALGSQLLWQAGYDATALYRLVDRAGKMTETKDFFSSELSTRELTAERAGTLREFVGKVLKQSAVNNRFEARFKARVK